MDIKGNGRARPLTRSANPNGISILKGQDEDSQDEEATAIPAAMKIAAGLKAASAQAVNRGHSVSMIEVPNEEGDMAYQIWLAKERTPAIAKKEMTSDEPARSSTTPVLTRGWCKPFKVDWTLHAICEA
ncbi:uncharacterized protein ARMOST_03226 [Armillaria ostoyae]|uniref:Uncharacterized protein n=1 Tax=Armillaria ostoyae TaxID=47428 RepID=A0A284QTV4_ARMOS|nr:uncharacterized protein ARMOST_03226 [Armillaria ostoyae]